MSNWYLLPCTCGESIRILPRHAGESRSCECGRTIEIPTLREIRRLDTAPDQPQPSASPSRSRSRQQRYWHPFWGVTFGLGILTMLIGLGVAARYTWLTGRIPAELLAKPTREQLVKNDPDELFRLNIDELTLLDSVEKVWNPLSKYPELPERFQPRHLFMREARNRFQQRSRWSLIAAGCGLALSVIPFFFSRKK